MIKKALVRTVILKYIENNKLDTVESVFDNWKDIYTHLKSHEDFGDLTTGCPPEEFLIQMERGFFMAKNGIFVGGMNVRF